MREYIRKLMFIMLSTSTLWSVVNTHQNVMFENNFKVTDVMIFHPKTVDA